MRICPSKEALRVLWVGCVVLTLVIATGSSSCSGDKSSETEDTVEVSGDAEECVSGSDCDDGEPMTPAAVGPTAAGMEMSGAFRHLPLPIQEGEFLVEEGGIEQVPDISSGIFADLDGDGFPEVIIGNNACCEAAKGFRTFQFDPDTGSLVPADSALSVGPNIDKIALSAAVDLDGDGRMDFVSPVFRKVFVQGEQNAQHHSPILYGDENGQLAYGGPIPSPTGDEREIQSHAMDLVDLDSDGWLDILVSEMDCENSDGASVHPLIRVGAREYVRHEEWFEATPQSKAEVVFARPIVSDPMVVFSGGHNCSNGDPIEAFFETAAIGPEGNPSFSSFDPTSLESVYKHDPFVSFGPISVAEPMGCALMDFNHDGRLDLAISLTHYHAMFEGTDEGVLIDRTLEMAQSISIEMKGGERMIPWAMAPVDLDLDGFMDLVIAHGDRTGANVLNMGVEKDSSATQYTTSFRNRGRFVFDDISDETGLAAYGNWHSITVGDLNRDGLADLIVGGAGVLPRVYLNELTTPHHGFALELRGATSNPLGIGAIIEVTTSATPPQLGVMGNAVSPYVVSQPLVFFGTGTAETVDTLRVTWPSGYVQMLHDVPAQGVHVLDEPPLIELDPNSRHLPAGSGQEMRIQVRPHDVNGQPMDALVAIESPWGEAIFSGPSEKVDGEVWERRLVAPEEPGSSVIEVTIDGVPLRVRPRIWWD